jgi:hypothetical protein
MLESGKACSAARRCSRQEMLMVFRNERGSHCLLLDTRRWRAPDAVGRARADRSGSTSKREVG